MMIYVCLGGHFKRIHYMIIRFVENQLAEKHPVLGYLVVVDDAVNRRDKAYPVDHSYCTTL